MRGMNSQFSTSTQQIGPLWIAFLFASLELLTSGSPRIALAQQAFCANSQNDPQCETFLRTQRARCEAEGRIWDANQNACSSARELTDPVRQLVQQNADRMGAAAQQARDQANRAAQTLEQLAGDNLRYSIIESDFPGQPILVGLPRHLDVFTQNFLPTLFYEKNQGELLVHSLRHRNGRTRFRPGLQSRQFRLLYSSLLQNFGWAFECWL
jgi:hypothetical protein